VAGGVLLLQQTAPSPGFLGDETVGLIQNIWTEPAHRRRGLAGWIVREMVACCRARRIRRLFLNATEDGRGVYTALGFRPSTTAMTLTLGLDDQP
jgi:predicted GNAT family acetyltransferase